MSKQETPTKPESQLLAAKILDERKKIGDTITQQLQDFEPFLRKIKSIRNATPLKNNLEETCTEPELMAICEKAQKELAKIGK